MAQKIFQVIITTIYDISGIDFDNINDKVILLSDKPIITKSFLAGPKTFNFNILSKSHDFKIIALISKEDFLKTADLKKILSSTLTSPISLLLPYISPPELSYRDDGIVRSCVFSCGFIPKKLSLLNKIDFCKVIYDNVIEYLNSEAAVNISILQLGKPYEQKPKLAAKKLLEKAQMIIPHKGNIKFLERCLLNLRKAEFLPSNINICFDDTTDKLLNRKLIETSNFSINCYANSPLNVGPYLPRHYLIESQGSEYIFFQDSDDISVKERFIKQMDELKQRKLDLIGSHELRVDQMQKKIMILRFPLDANYSLNQFEFHSLFHPTSLITKSAYLKTGGFSTNKKFGYDSQFLLRANFSLKIGNIDDFLYIRFKRPNSLTTHYKTKIGGMNLRRFLLWRWNTDFRLIKQGKLKISDSSISVQKHKFKYKINRL